MQSAAFHEAHAEGSIRELTRDRQTGRSGTNDADVYTEGRGLVWFG
jgi:hypothetical protein